MRLWDGKETKLDKAVLRFTVGDDPILDRQLVPFDCLASAAHATMLAEIGILAATELEDLIAALREVHSEALAGRFVITEEQEDGHTAIEEQLTARLGDAGKKIHTGRSRNDQVMMAVRLYTRERLLALSGGLTALIEANLDKSEQHLRDPMPGYTHTRQAMPTTVGQFFAAAAEGLLRDLETLTLPLALANRSVSGAASGFGVPLPLRRERVAELLGLQGLELNTVHAQNTRGKLEAATLFALHQVSLTLSRAATELIWYSSEALGFLSLPDALTTGSSIMPQKRNPDLLELTRACAASMLARYVEVTGLLHGLPFGYHRDLQRTKGPLLAGLREAADLVTVMRQAAEQVTINPEHCRAALTNDIFATDLAYAHVRAGLPFREAYQRAKEESGAGLDPEATLAERTHAGAPGTSQAAALREELRKVRSGFEPFAKGHAQALAILS